MVAPPRRFNVRRKEASTRDIRIRRIVGHQARRLCPRTRGSPHRLTGLRCEPESSTLMCCGHSPGTAATCDFSRIASPWYGRPDRSGPAPVLLRQRSPSRLPAAKERSEKPPSARRTAWVQRVIQACGFLRRRFGNALRYSLTRQRRENPAMGPACSCFQLVVLRP